MTTVDQDKRTFFNTDMAFQLFKYAVYGLLSMNIYHFFVEDFSASSETFANGIALSQIIEELNSRFGTEFDDEDLVPVMQGMMAKLNKNESLEASMRSSPEDAAKLSFNQTVDNHMQELIESNFQFYKQVTDNEAYGRAFKDHLFQMYKGLMDARLSGAT